MNKTFIDSNPLQFVFRISAPLANSKYTWLNTTKTRPFPSVDIQTDFLYQFYAFNFSADISELDYQAAIDIQDQGLTGNELNANTIPTFSLYCEGYGKSVILRQPIGLPSYYAGINYTQLFKPRMKSGTGSANTSVIQLTGEQVNNLQGSFKSVLNHTAALIGKQNINLIFTLFAREISVDEHEAFLSNSRR